MMGIKDLPGVAHKPLVSTPLSLLFLSPLGGKLREGTVMFTSAASAVADWTVRHCLPLGIMQGLL